MHATGSDNYEQTYKKTDMMLRNTYMKILILNCNYGVNMGSGRGGGADQKKNKKNQKKKKKIYEQTYKKHTKRLT